MQVIDLAAGAAASIGRDLALLGAQVVRIEPRGGHHDRMAAPVVDGLSIDFAIRNLGKTNVELELGDPEDRAAFRALLADADVLIESMRPGSAEAAQLDAADVAAQHPTLVILSISDFGQAGAYARWQATSPEANMYIVENHFKVIGPETPAFQATQPWVKGFNGEVFWQIHPQLARLWIDSALKTASGH